MSAPVAGDDEVEMQRAGDRIERLLGELRGSLSPSAWARVEEVVTCITSLHGHGLERMLEAFAGEHGIEEHARQRLCDDPLVESLLLLHGLHPLPLDERVNRAVERVRRAIGENSGDVASSVDDRGSLSVRLVGDWRRCPVPSAAVETALRHALVEAAPEIARVAIERDGSFLESSAHAQAHASDLVQIDLSRSRRGSPSEAAE